MLGTLKIMAKAFYKLVATNGKYSLADLELDIAKEVCKMTRDCSINEALELWTKHIKDVAVRSEAAWKTYEDGCTLFNFRFKDGSCFAVGIKPETKSIVLRTTNV